MPARPGLRRSLARTAAAVAVTAALLAPSAPASANGPGYQKPSVGECRDLTLTQANARSNSTAPIDCAVSHTDRVVAVAQLPKAMTWSASAAALVRASTKACQADWAAALGRTDKVRDSSAYVLVFFIPTKAQRTHGARWIRCDLALAGGTRLLPLPTDTTPALGTSPLPDSVAGCLTATYFYRTTCARTHAFRASGAFTLDRAKYPTQTQLQAAAERRCPALVSTSRWRWSTRGKGTWLAGDHTVVCYARTTG